MENTSLVGLSRQVALRRELDVIANNLANTDTTGFKAERCSLKNIVMPVARDETFQSADQPVSYVQDRATAHDMSRRRAQDDRQSARPRHRRRRLLHRRRPPSGERYQRNGSFQINRDGELVTHEGYQVLGDSGPIRFEPTDTDITIASDGTISTVNGNTTSTRGKLKLVAVRGSHVARQGRRLDLALQLRRRGPAVDHAGRSRARSSSPTSRRVVQMTRMIEVTRAYTNLAALMKSGDELRQEAIKSLAEVQA